MYVTNNHTTNNYNYRGSFSGKVPFRKIIQPQQPNKPAGMPMVAWHPWIDVRRRDDIQRLNIPIPMGIMPMEWTYRIKQSYFAAAFYIDDIIGTLLKRVDLKRFIVVVTSDHGETIDIINKYIHTLTFSLLSPSVRRNVNKLGNFRYSERILLQVICYGQCLRYARVGKALTLCKHFFISVQH